MEKLKHIAVVLIALFLFLMLPVMHYVDVGAYLSGDLDAVSRASDEIPERPEGELIVLINKEKHGKYLEEWNNFFLEQDVGVIMEDIHCLVMTSDPAGVQLAERYQARLAENQMTIRKENPVLVSSMGEEGMFDMIILSREASEDFGFSDFGENILVIEVKGE